MNDKTFCINCFDDFNIRNFIKKNGKIINDKNYKCGFCQTYDSRHNDKYEILDYHIKERMKLIDKELYVISQDILNQEIIRIINEHYEFIRNPQYTEKNLVNICSILDDFFKDHTGVLIRLSKYDFINYPEYPFNEKNYKTYVDNSKVDYTTQKNHWLNWWKPKKSFNWEKFKKHTKHKARFFEHKESPVNIREELKQFKFIFNSLKVLGHKQHIFRARELNPKLKEKLNSSSKEIQRKELGKAPIEIVKNNRFSPIGISYGYFSFNKETALSEIRAEIGQEVVIGHFTLKENLNLIDFTKNYMFSNNLKDKSNPFDKDKFNILLLDLYSFIFDISKPILPNDTSLEYVPTQIMSEYIWSLGYDGFMFDSSQYKDGKNIILFDCEPNYQKYERVKITTKNIEFDTL